MSKGYNPQTTRQDLRNEAEAASNDSPAHLERLANDRDARVNERTVELQERLERSHPSKVPQLTPTGSSNRDRPRLPGESRGLPGRDP